MGAPGSEEGVEEGEAEALRLEVEEEGGVLGEEGGPLEPGQDLVGAEEGVEVQVVPRQCRVGLASRPAEGLPASLAQKQRSLPAQSLEESPQRQGQQRWVLSARAPIPAVPFPAAPGALALVARGPVSPASPARGGPAARARVPVSLAPVAPAPGALAPASPSRTSPSPSFLSPAFPAPALSAAAALEVASFEFPILLVTGHSELGQEVVNFV